MSNTYYYRLYLFEGKINVVEMQASDEPNYDQTKFVTCDGGRLVFQEDFHAIEYLNKHFQLDSIHPDYITPEAHRR